MEDSWEAEVTLCFLMRVEICLSFQLVNERAFEGMLLRGRLLPKEHYSQFKCQAGSFTCTLYNTVSTLWRPRWRSLMMESPGQDMTNQVSEHDVTGVCNNTRQGTWRWRLLHREWPSEHQYTMSHVYAIMWGEADSFTIVTSVLFLCGRR